MLGNGGLFKLVEESLLPLLTLFSQLAGRPPGSEGSQPQQGDSGGRPSWRFALAIIASTVGGATAGGAGGLVVMYGSVKVLEKGQKQNLRNIETLEDNMYKVIRDQEELRARVDLFENSCCRQLSSGGTKTPSDRVRNGSKGQPTHSDDHNQ